MTTNVIKKIKITNSADDPMSGGGSSNSNSAMVPGGGMLIKRPRMVTDQQVQQGQGDMNVQQDQQQPPQSNDDLQSTNQPNQSLNVQNDNLNDNPMTKEQQQNNKHMQEFNKVLENIKAANGNILNVTAVSYATKVVSLARPSPKCKSIPLDLREHLVPKIVQEIFSTNDMSDKRNSNFIGYARKVEGDIYEIANTRFEYYHLLAEKIYKDQKKKEEERKKKQLESELNSNSPSGMSEPQQQQNQAPQAQQQDQQQNANQDNPNNPLLADPEKSSLIRQQLSILLHAEKCIEENCWLQHCKMFKQVLEHMPTCNLGKTCPRTECYSSRRIVHHWKNCNDSYCPVCMPFKNSKKNKNQQPVPEQQVQQGQGDMNVQQGQQQPSQSNVDLQSTNQPNQSLISKIKQQALTHMQEFNKVLENIKAANGNIANATAISSKTGVVSNFGQRNLPGQSTGSKRWHQFIMSDLRNRLGFKIVQAIFPTNDMSVMYDIRKFNLIAYARKVEGDIYEMANTRSEYYHLLAEKIYKIEKELDEKREKKSEQQAQVQAQQQQANQVRMPPLNSPQPGPSNSRPI